MPAPAPELELLTSPPPAASTSSRIGLHAPSLLYSADTRYLFQRQAHVVRVLHAPSGRVLHDCVRVASKSAVRALALHPHNALHLLAAYDDGKVLVWDVVAPTPVLELDVAAPILWMASSHTWPSHLLLVLQVDATTWQLVEWSLHTKKRGRVLFQNPKHPFQTAALQSYTTPRGHHVRPGDYVVLVAKQTLVTLWLDDRPGPHDLTHRVVTMHKQRHVRPVVCVAVSPTQPEFAIGDQLGQIFRHHSYTMGTPLVAQMHWHAHAVHCLQYSSNGQFLVSGGEECVLVSWHLESGRRAYLPRLPAPVETIAARPTGAVYVVQLAANVVFQYNAVTREQEWEVRGLARAGTSAASSLPTRQLIVDPVSKSLVLNGPSCAGDLQFYEPLTDRVLHTLVLSERNQVTRTKNEVLPTLRALFTCFGQRGHDVVTLHAPTIAHDGTDHALRFWTRRSDGTFFVNTAVDAPHDRARVTCMAYAPSTRDDTVVSGDDRGDFKVWAKTTVDNESGAWQCQAVVRFRDEPVTAVAFACDGSLLAVAYGTKVTLWDVATHALRHVLASADGHSITQLVFPGLTSPYLVVVTREQVQVWNLLALALAWRYPVPNGTVVADTGRHERILVCVPVDGATPKTLVLVFAAHSAIPTWVRVVHLDHHVWTAGFHPTTGDVILVDTETGIWRLTGPHATSRKTHCAAVKAQDTTPRQEEEGTKCRGVYTGATAKKASPTGHGHVRVAKAPSSQFFDAPAHVLPPMTALYRSFMDTMLLKPHRGGQGEAVDTPKALPRPQTTLKRRQKHDDQAVELAAWVQNEEAAQRQRLQEQVAKELANPGLQQQTYANLRETFRNTKARRT